MSLSLLGGLPSSLLEIVCLPSSEAACRRRRSRNAPVAQSAGHLVSCLSRTVHCALLPVQPTTPASEHQVTSSCCQRLRASIRTTERHQQQDSDNSADSGSHNGACVLAAAVRLQAAGRCPVERQPIAWPPASTEYVSQTWRGFRPASTKRNKPRDPAAWGRVMEEGALPLQNSSMLPEEDPELVRTRCHSRSRDRTGGYRRPSLPSRPPLSAPSASAAPRALWRSDQRPLCSPRCPSAGQQSE